MIIAFLFALCSMCLFDWWRIRCAFLRQHHLWAAAVLAVMLVILLTPVWSRMLFGRNNMPRLIEQLGWIWLAWIFWLASTFLLLLLLNCLLRLFHLPVLPETIQVYIALGIMVTMTTWGTIEANAIRLHQIVIESPRIPKAAGDYTIAMISDLHIGNAATEHRVQRAVDLVNQSQPNLILSAGDMVDGHGERERELMSVVATMSGTEDCLKLAVPGNHDVYSDLAFSRECHEQAGFRLLENEGTAVNDWLWLYGEKDPAQRHSQTDNQSADTTLPPNWPPELQADSTRFRLLLKHRPDGVSSVFGPNAPFDLELSGHSHGGQIVPFNFLVRLQHPFREGRLHTLDNGMKLYVSPGTGLWGMPFRVCARPEVTLIILRHGESDNKN